MPTPGYEEIDASLQYLTLLIRTDERRGMNQLSMYVNADGRIVMRRSGAEEVTAAYRVLDDQLTCPYCIVGLEASGLLQNEMQENALEVSYGECVRMGLQAEVCLELTHSGWRAILKNLVVDRPFAATTCSLHR